MADLRCVKRVVGNVPSMLAAVLVHIQGTVVLYAERRARREFGVRAGVALGKDGARWHILITGKGGSRILKETRASRR
jgi:hypothetical protein